jgi:hypothetical protein
MLHLLSASEWGWTHPHKKCPWSFLQGAYRYSGELEFLSILQITAPTIQRTISAAM